VVRKCAEVIDFVDGPTEIRTRVSAVRGQRPWPLDDGALLLQKFRGRDSNPDSTVQSRMSCLLDDPGVIVVVLEGLQSSAYIVELRHLQILISPAHSIP
jgi:hypothetical protein